MESLKEMLEDRPDLRKYLFIRGFLVTNASVNTDKFPFYGTWKQFTLVGFHFLTHPLTGFYHVRVGDVLLFLLGHAYNPFSMEISEEKILQRLGEHFDKDDFYEYVNELSGSFVLGAFSGERLLLLVDPVGHQSVCAGEVEGYFYLTSHAQIVADICGLEMDPFVQKLVAYKWYNRVLGPYLPADLTPYLELKRLNPNVEYILEKGSLQHRRFYPLNAFEPFGLGKEYNAVIRDAAEILKSSMTLIGQKWKNPWISLSGGLDSNTLFAAANGNYDRFSTFSYDSAPKEAIDCEVAQRVASAFKVPWRRFYITKDPNDIPDYNIKAAILHHNNSLVADAPSNEQRKRMVLEQDLHCDVEVKGWGVVQFRTYWYSHFNRRTLPPLSGKLFRNLYKIFISNRRLAHEVDQIFNVYIEKYEYNKIPATYLPSDMYSWEMLDGAWNSLNLSEMKFYAEIVNPYNNRRLIDLLIRCPFEVRFSGQHHLDMKKYLNRELYDMGLRVENMHETVFRARCLNLILH